MPYLVAKMPQYRPVHFIHLVAGHFADSIVGFIYIKCDQPMIMTSQ